MSERASLTPTGGRAPCRRLVRSAILVGALLALPAAVGFAQTAQPTQAELEQARARFAEARRLEEAGEWSRALELLQRVAEVKMTPQVRFHIALCMEHVGLLTEALAGYARASREASEPPGAPDVVKEAREHMTELEARIPTVSVSVSGALPGDQLLLDRRPIPLEGTPPVRVDPGPHTAELRRGDKVIARETFVASGKVTKNVELRAGNVAPDPEAPPSASAVAAPSASAPPVPADPGATQRTIGFVALGAGVVSGVATAIFVGLRAGALADIEEQCSDLLDCDPSLQGTESDGRTFTALANVFAITTAVGIVAGGVLIFSAPPASPKPIAVTRVSPFIGPGVAGIAIGGGF